MVIARILHGSSIDRQGMLHTGDIIREVNGREVGRNPLELQEQLRDCSGSITLKVLPSYRDTPASPQVRKGRLHRIFLSSFAPVGNLCYTEKSVILSIYLILFEILKSVLMCRSSLPRVQGC